MKPVAIKPDIYWVGAIDWAVRDFHGYVTPQGTSYNNYLILDEQPTLLDTVKYDFAEVTISNIKQLVDPAQVKNIIINHIENDHMSGLEQVMALTPQATIYITARGRKGMERFFDISKWNVKVVKTGEELKIGRYTLLFIETPMLHWPDSMMTYVKEAQLLISQDAFGQHYATTAMFDDQFVQQRSQAELEDAVIDYYANILMPFAKLIQAKIAQLQQLNLAIDMIAPDHGIIWRQGPEKVIQMYLDMAQGKALPRVAIIYDTMWHGTEEMTLPMMRGVLDEGVGCQIIKLRETPTSAAIKELWKSRGFLIGSPTLNNDVFPSVANFITYLRGLRPTNRIAGAFGCYGWSGGAVKWLYEQFEQMNLQTMQPGLEVLYKSRAEDHEKCYQFGQQFARNLKEYHQTIDQPAT